jgi:hypothetical protein
MSSYQDLIAQDNGIILFNRIVDCAKQSWQLLGCDIISAQKKYGKEKIENRFSVFIFPLKPFISLAHSIVHLSNLHTYIF